MERFKLLLVYLLQRKETSFPAVFYRIGLLLWLIEHIYFGS